MTTKAQHLAENRNYASRKDEGIHTTVTSKFKKDFQREVSRAGLSESQACSHAVILWWDMKRKKK